MLVTLDLNSRQTARVLAEAVHIRAMLEIEPRPDAFSDLLWGTLSGRGQDGLYVELHERGPDIDLAGLVGAMCDVRMILARQLYLFATFVVDSVPQTAPQRLVIEVPQTIQVANRRRFARQAPLEPVPVRITVPAVANTFVGILANINPTGLACRLSGRELDEVLFIGDQAQLEFALPWSAELYTLPAVACTKSRSRQEEELMVGFEFAGTADEASLKKLRQSLRDQAARLVEEG